MTFSTLNGDLNHHTLFTMDTLSKTYPINSSTSFAKAIFENFKQTFTSTNNSHTTTTKVSMFEPISSFTTVDTTQSTIIPYRCENSIFRKKAKSVDCPSTQDLEKSLEIWKIEGNDQYSGEQRRHFKPFKVLFDRIRDKGINK
ncbi:hypothetical protein MG7_05065 [Candida albicans P34048]|nr:hypothetical protein MG7_05065 [Candida albicans P34048]